MTNEDFKKRISGIETKLGKENASIIADDLANLISDNISMNKTIADKDNIITEKTELNNKLVMANSSLLQQVGVPDDSKKITKENKEDDEEQKISWEDCFDKKGNFLK